MYSDASESDSLLDGMYQTFQRGNIFISGTLNFSTLVAQQQLKWGGGQSPTMLVNSQLCVCNAHTAMHVSHDLTCWHWELGSEPALQSCCPSQKAPCSEESRRCVLHRWCCDPGINIVPLYVVKYHSVWWVQCDIQRKTPVCYMSLLETSTVFISSPFNRAVQHLHSAH